ncbi:DALR domain-containing protein, partial [Streptococcus pyogenes]
DSPWGFGRPGWHIECSVMATEILGDTIDIHGGGADLEFPHHTNEIAQSEAKTGKTFANYWMHNGFVTVDNEKMSKSLGNFVTVHDMLQTVDGQVLRFFLATQQYRKPINFTEKAIHDAEINLKYLKNTLQQPLTETADEQELKQFVIAFQDAMDDDFNTANGITVVFDMAKWINSGSYTGMVKEAFEKILAVFGIVFEEEVLDADIEALIAKRQEARTNRDFATADAIRDQLAAQGIKLLDTKDGVRWTRD